MYSLVTKDTDHGCCPENHSDSLSAKTAHLPPISTPSCLSCLGDKSLLFILNTGIDSSLHLPQPVAFHFLHTSLKCSQLLMLMKSTLSVSFYGSCFGVLSKELCRSPRPCAVSRASSTGFTVLVHPQSPASYCELVSACGTQ